MLSSAQRVVLICLVSALCACSAPQVRSNPPADSRIVGTWRFVKAGEQSIRYPFFLKFRNDGTCKSGPTPHAVVQHSTYTFDGNQAVVTHQGEDLVLRDIRIEGKTMTMPAVKNGEPIMLTYKRVWPW